MYEKVNYTEYIQWHNTIDFFNYDIVIDWAIYLLENGYENESLYVLASFRKPSDSREIKPYVSEALNDLNLEEKSGEYSIIAQTYFHIQHILNDISIRKNLNAIYTLSCSLDHGYGLSTFYHINNAWTDLEEGFPNFYYKGVTSDNIEQFLKKEARKWVSTYFHR